jgi:hypothetical protein
VAGLEPSMAAGTTAGMAAEVGNWNMRVSSMARQTLALMHRDTGAPGGAGVAPGSNWLTLGQR